MQSRMSDKRNALQDPASAGFLFVVPLDGNWDSIARGLSGSGSVVRFQAGRDGELAIWEPAKLAACGASGPDVATARLSTGVARGAAVEGGAWGRPRRVTQDASAVQLLCSCIGVRRRRQHPSNFCPHSLPLAPTGRLPLSASPDGVFEI